jgi:biopolymer transport protein ExbD
MASIAVGEKHGGRRAVDHAIPLVPFIDFMICLIAFLMVTAAWTQMSRIEASARAAGGALGPATEPAKELHVLENAQGFELRWQRGATVLETQRVPRVSAAAVTANADKRYPELTRAITREWETQGEHRAEADQKLDRAVIHVPNDAPFDEVVAMLDALHAPRRGKHSAFEVSFATN